MQSRRTFVHSLLGAGIAAPVLRGDAFTRLVRAGEASGSRPALAVADDESYWTEIQRAFDLDRTMVNLNNGGCSPAPTHVLEQMIRDLRFSNELPVDHMWRVLEPRIESVRRDLAREFGCDPEEMAITRNASEANETMIFGLDLKAGDEVVMTTQNYPRMQNAWRLTPSPTFPSPATSWVATTTARASTSGCSRRSVPASSTCAATGSSRSGH